MTQAMENLDRRLVRKGARLIQLLDPPFDKSDLNPGYIKGYVPGVRENGGQYTHSAIWTIMATAALGDSDIVRLAVRHGVQLAYTRLGRIEPDEGRAPYLALTGFPPRLRPAIDLLSRQGLMSPERAAYIVHHGVWSLPEVEGIILSSTYPDLVLSGDVMPEQRHLYRFVSRICG
jgi:hypothetical protein